MTISTITTTITAAVSPGTGNYAYNLTISNTGAVIAPGSAPAIAGGSVTNNGLLSSSDDNFTVQQTRFLDNAGTIIGTYALNGGRYGILINSGIITGRQSGVSGGSTITNLGSITGGLTGVEGRYGTVWNSGSIYGGATGVSNGYGTVVNSGSIYGGTLGLSTADGYAHNSGSIGGGLTAVSVFSSTFNNSGDITGGLTGVLLGGRSSSFSNTGAVTGAIQGILATGGYGAQIASAGIIAGGVNAIYADNQFLDLTLDPGAALSGAVVDKSGTGTLILGGSGAGHIDIGTWSGFDSITISQGSQWVLEGGTTQLAGGEPILGFQSGDTLVIDGVAASTASFVSGTGLELAGVTLGLATQFSGESFAVNTSGGNTTIVATGPTHGLVSTINTVFSQEVTAGTANYAANLTITNTGTLAGGISGGNASGVTVTNDGVISGAASFLPPGYRSGDVFINNGAITDFGYVSMRGSLVVNTGSISGFVNITGELENSGVISGDVEENFGSLIVDSGTILGDIRGRDDIDLAVDPGAVFGGNVGGGKNLSLTGHGVGSLDLDGHFSGFNAISFGSGVDWSLEGTANQLAKGQLITGFTFGDTIILDGFTATNKVYAAHSELVLIGATDETLGITGDYSTAQFTVSSDGDGNTTIALCFLEGTRIATPTGETAVEDLQIGDLVRTRLAGTQRVKWIGLRSYDGRFIAANHLALPVCLKRHALAKDVPSRDLWVSPGHGIYVGRHLVPAWRLVNGVSVTQPAWEGPVRYLHVELEHHDLLLAENCLAESFYDEALRGQFQNSAEFAALYPGAAGARRPCTKRLEEGFTLLAAQRRVARRAGVAVGANAFGGLRGFVDVAMPGNVRGWAQCVAAPEAPVTLDIFIGGRRAGRVLANGYREDLRRAGLGSGCHAFSFAGKRNWRGAVEGRRAADGARLALTEAAAAA